MSTLAQITDKVLAELRSYVRDQELSTHLTAPADADDLTLTVNDTGVMSRGRVQIDDELIWVDSVDRNGSTVTLPPYGRGVDGSTAASHTVGTRVIMQPLYPRKMVMDTINQCVQAMGVHLFGSAEVEFTPADHTFVYEMPSATRDVIAVKLLDDEGNVARLRDWTFDPKAPLSSAATGKALYLYNNWLHGVDTIVASYISNPVLFATPSSDFSTTLLPATSEDVLTMLAASRLLASAESYNLQTRSIEANVIDTRIQPGQAVAQSKYLYQLAQQRLQEEREQLLKRTPIRSHYSR